MGYILIDHSASLPSVQKEYGKKVEYDSTSCKHCQAVLRIVHRQPVAYFCMRCGGWVCNTKKCAETCTPYYQKIEQQIKQRLERDRVSARFFEHMKVNS